MTKQIDEKFIEMITDSLKQKFKNIQSAIDFVLNKEQDIFKRYHRFHRLLSLNFALEKSLELSSMSYKMGADLCNKQLHSKGFKEDHWDDTTIENNPFFIDDECESATEFNINESNLTEEQKKLLMDIIKKSVR